MRNKILKMIGRRIIQSCVTIFLVTLIVFMLIQMVPGDAVTNFLGASATEEQIAYYTQLYGYDQPVIVQYFKWISGLFHGTMGLSISYQREISEVIFPRFLTTLSVVIPAFIIAVVVGILLGIAAAQNRGKWIDTIVSFFANIGVSMPVFWLGIVLMLVVGLQLGILPTSGYTRISNGVGEWIQHLILPVLTLSAGVVAQFMRQTRSSMLEVIRQDYVTTAKAKGVDKKTIIVKHQLRNALIPIVTVMGNRLGGMVGGTVLIESLFVIPGLGNLMITSINSRDYMVVANGVLVIAVFVALCNLAVDILYGIIDPRTR